MPDSCAEREVEQLAVAALREGIRDAERISARVGAVLAAVAPRKRARTRRILLQLRGSMDFYDFAYRVVEPLDAGQPLEEVLDELEAESSLYLDGTPADPEQSWPNEDELGGWEELGAIAQVARRRLACPTSQVGHRLSRRAVRGRGRSGRPRARRSTASSSSSSSSSGDDGPPGHLGPAGGRSRRSSYSGWAVVS